ncbi:MAG: hypothetical protein FWC80_01925 [Firmicutes bacterium]|nr:hypothetical protein [Bacillota bacterium]
MYQVVGADALSRLTTIIIIKKLRIEIFGRLRASAPTTWCTITILASSFRNNNYATKTYTSKDYPSRNNQTST